MPSASSLQATAGVDTSRQRLHLKCDGSQQWIDHHGSRPFGLHFNHIAKVQLWLLSGAAGGEECLCELSAPCQGIKASNGYCKDVLLLQTACNRLTGTCFLSCNLIPSF